MLFSYKIFTFSQLPNKFYNRKFQNIHLTQSKIKIKTFLLLNPTRKSERWREREIDREREDQSGSRTVAARSAIGGGGQIGCQDQY